MSQVWAIEPRALEAIARAGEPARARAALGARAKAVVAGGGMTVGGSYRRQGSCAVIDVVGAIDQSGDYGTSVGELCAALDAAAADGSVSSAMLDIDCVGGTVAGMSDVFAAMDRFRAAGKRITALAHDRCFSAAYWIAARCDEIWATPTAMVGSIGVAWMALDVSRAMADAGVEPFVIAMPAGKANAVNTLRKFTPENTADMVAMCGRYYAMFRADVAAGRGMSPEDVDALDAAVRVAGDAGDLVDGVVDADAALARMLSKERNEKLAARVAAHAGDAAIVVVDGESPLGRMVGAVTVKSTNKPAASVAAVRVSTKEHTMSTETTPATPARASLAELRAKFNDPGFVLAMVEKGATLIEAEAQWNAKKADEAMAKADALAKSQAEAEARLAKVQAELEGLRRHPARAGADPIKSADADGRHAYEIEHEKRVRDYVAQGIVGPRAVTKAHEDMLATVRGNQLWADWKNARLEAAAASRKSA